MKISRAQLRRLIKEEKAKIIQEMDPRALSGPDPQTMKSQILSLAEVIDEEGMATVLNVLEEPWAGNYHDGLTIINDHVRTASPEDLTWIHQELTAEGLFDYYGV